MSENKPKLLLLGFGDVNQRLAQLRKTHSEITAIRRSKVSATDIKCQAGDAADQEFLEHVLSEVTPDQIVITLSPSEHSEQGYKKTYLGAAKALVKATQKLGPALRKVSGKAPEVIFISSSSVYSQNNGEIIDEESECSPTRYNGQTLVKAEQCLLQSDLPATIIRFSGIYGPGRYRLLESSLSVASPPEVIHWTNRIHATDCARTIDHILNIPVKDRDEIYLASDNTPIPSHLVKNWIAHQLAGKELPASPDNQICAEGIKTTGKRCNNSLLQKSGFEFKYPGYKEGFPEIIAEYLNQGSQ